MGIAVVGDPVGHQLDGVLYGSPDARFGLEGQSEHQVMADGGIPDLPRQIMHFFHLLEGLDAVDGLLNHRVVVLYPKAVSPRPKVIKGLQLQFARVIGMALVAELEVVEAVGPYKYPVYQLAEVLCREEGRGPASQVDLLDLRALVEQVAIQVPFPEQGLDIGGFHAVPLGDPFVAGAKGAEVLAEGQMNVQADPFALVALAEGPNRGLLPVGRIYALLVPEGHRGIARIPGSGDVVFLDQCRIHLCVIFYFVPYSFTASMKAPA